MDPPSTLHSLSTIVSLKKSFILPTLSLFSLNSLFLIVSASHFHVSLPSTILRSLALEAYIELGIFLGALCIYGGLLSQ